MNPPQIRTQIVDGTGRPVQTHELPWGREHPVTATTVATGTGESGELVIVVTHHIAL